jgi:hypothetical protein
MFKTRINLGLAALFLLLAHPAFSKTVTIFPFHGDTVHPQIKSAARDALSIFLTDEGLLVQGNDVKAPIQNRAAASAAAKAVKVERYIEGRITRLGNRAIIQVIEFDVNQNMQVHSDRMTAASPSDLESVMQRLARSIATGKVAQVNEDIYTVTEQEQRALNRKVANQYFGVTLGGSLFPGIESSFLPGWGLSWLWDNRDYLFGLDLRLHGVGMSSTLCEISMSGYVPLSEADTTPYVGGGIALGGLDLPATDNGDHGFNDQSGTGLSFFGAAGVLIGRTSTVAIRPEIAYSIGTFSVDEQIVHGLRVGITLGF